MNKNKWIPIKEEKPPIMENVWVKCDSDIFENIGVKKNKYGVDFMEENGNWDFCVVLRIGRKSRK